MWIATELLSEFISLGVLSLRRIFALANFSLMQTSISLSAATKYYLWEFCSASHSACDRWNAFTCNYTCIVASYWITLIRYWFASPNKYIARRKSMACQRQCNRLDIESNRVEKEQQSIRKMIMKNEHDPKASGAEEKREEKKNARAGNEQHYFCLNEKQSHRGSLRLRDATASQRLLLPPKKNQPRYPTLIRNHEKSEMQWARLFLLKFFSSCETISFSSLHRFLFEPNGSK